MLAEKIISLLRERRQTLVLAESCTAGLVSDAIASVPGASDVFWGAFVVYTVAAKRKVLGIPQELIDNFGAVSRECAMAMSELALSKSEADIAAAVTGHAGPPGPSSPPALTGTIWIAVCKRGGLPQAALCQYKGTRNKIRRAAANALLEKILAEIAPS
ncbi:MAG: CinA family protein [Spirochaetaceae bacterium]|jgi:PncC family amidohydrolase|nr:CinA family protein [Spirochaetaceae bacterium]